MVRCVRLDVLCEMPLGAHFFMIPGRIPVICTALACALFWLAVVSHAAARANLSPRRGVTIGPIESALHPGKGYGSAPYQRTLDEVRAWGGTWISLTPFGRTLDLQPTGVDLTFEAPFEQNRRAVLDAIRMAHARGLRVLLVPHLWVESGAWRAEINPGSDAAWERWARGYRAFLLAWAQVAQEANADMFSVGVELRSWACTNRAPSLLKIIREVRLAYDGPLTYSANWDDVDDTVILGELEVIGINAFYPLAQEQDADFVTLLRGGETVAAKVRALSENWRRPVLFTEIGYTTRANPAVRPWEWPDAMKGVKVDQQAQADAYRALLAPVLEEPGFLGFFVWRVYADPNDMSQEAEWGFSPRGKRAELVVRDAFSTWWAADGPWEPGRALVSFRAERPGLH
ncbi:MAG: hypothetical protein MUF54_04005 [Polyangiaceae bacterium]|nr:hypothetical protein [Polyangiaceae bacterium]